MEENGNNTTWDVYEVRHRESGKIYVGVQKRLGKASEENYLGSGVAIRAAVDRYGRGAFEKRTIQSFRTEGDAYQLERQIVDRDFVARRSNYNVAEGGQGGDRFSTHPDKELYRSRLREASIRNKSHTHFGDCSGSNNGFFGRNHSVDFRQAVSERFSPENSPRSKRVEFNGERYPSVRAAERATGRNHHWLKKNGLKFIKA